MSEAQAKKCEEAKGMRKLSIFVTADTLLAAVLLVWAQLWIQPSIGLWSKWYCPDKVTKMPWWFETFDFNVGIGLALTSFAVFLALLALAWAGWRTLAISTDKTPATAIGLFAASLVMGIIDVSQSVYSVTRKLFSGTLVYQPLYIPDWFLYLGVLSALIIVFLSLWGAHRLCKDKYKNMSWKCRYLPWIIELAYLIVVGAIVLCRM